MLIIHYVPDNDSLPVCAGLVGLFDGCDAWVTEPSQATCNDCRAILNLQPIKVR